MSRLTATLVTGYFSEPVLVQAAAQLTNHQDEVSGSAKWKLLLGVLVKYLRAGTVDAGFRGKLVAKILLLLTDSMLSSGLFLTSM